MTSRNPTRLQSLIERVKRASSLRGKKTALGLFLGASRQQVHNWLVGNVAPGGEVALAMLEWVQAEEAKQTKTAPVLDAPARPKTRKLNSDHEKSSRVRRKP